VLSKEPKQKEFQEWNKPFSRAVEKCNNNGNTPIYIFMTQVWGRTRHKQNLSRYLDGENNSSVLLTGYICISKVNISMDYHSKTEYWVTQVIGYHRIAPVFPYIYIFQSLASKQRASSTVPM